jgi:lipopolysaccharide export system permease protein
VEPRGFAQLGETLSAEVDTMHLSVAELAREIEEVEKGGYDATTFRVDYHAKLAEPFACVVLPAVVLLFAVAGPPFPGPAQTLLVSGIVGVLYILLSGVFASLGYGGALPRPLGGWGPVLLFGSLAALLGYRLWRRR